MELFPKSPKDILRSRVYVKESDSDLLENVRSKLSLQQWERAAQHPIENNKTALDREMEETFGQVNGFLHQLEVAAKVHNRRNSVKYHDWKRRQATGHHFKEQVKLGHTLMGKMQELVDLEDSGLRLMKSYQNLPNNSTILSSEVTDIQESMDNISQSSCHSSEIRGMLRKFNRVLNNSGEISPSLNLLDIQLEEKGKRDSLVLRGDQECLQFLVDHLAKDNIQLTFQTLPSKDSKSNQTVVCKIFNITVEGNASEKAAAKKCAAVKMLERLVEDSLKNCLPSQITAFTKEQLKEAVHLLCQTEPYDSQLEELCQEHHKPQPRYFFETEQNQVQVLCSALGFQGISDHKTPVIAKRAAAWNILQLYKNKSKF